MDNERKFYTYAYLREDGTPYYIGKGKGGRINASKGRKFPLPPKERRIFLKTNLTEEEAFKHEIYLIAVLGRKDLGTGILWNFTDGGEGASGAVMSEEQRKEIAERNRGRKNFEGKQHTPETKEKIGKAHRGKVVSQETRKKMSDASKRRTRRPHSMETREKISKAHLGKVFSEKTREKMRQSALQRVERRRAGGE